MSYGVIFTVMGYGIRVTVYGLRLDGIGCGLDCTICHRMNVYNGDIDQLVFLVFALSQCEFSSNSQVRMSYLSLDRCATTV